MRFWHLALIASLLAPVSAQAYLDPEQVIFSDEFVFPPSPSQARDRVLQQNQVSIDRRNAVYADLAAQRDAAKAASSQSTQPVATTNGIDTQSVANQIAALLATLQGNGHQAAPSADQIQWTPVDQNDPLAGVQWEPVDQQEAPSQSIDDLLQNGNLDPATERLLKRLQAKKEEEQFAARFSGMVEQYHSGAPLADTGAGTYLSVVLIAGAAVWTLRRACRKGIVEVRW